MTPAYKQLKDIPPLEYWNGEFAWTMHPTDPMCIVVYHWGEPVMCLSLHEAIESSSRNAVLQHIVECDNSPWLTRWQEEKHACLVDLLTADYNASV